MSTATGSSVTTGAVSDMSIGVAELDTGLDTVEGDAADISAMEPEPELQRELQTPVLPIETSSRKKTVPREKKQTRKRVERIRV